MGEEVTLNAPLTLAGGCPITVEGAQGAWSGVLVEDTRWLISGLGTGNQSKKSEKLNFLSIFQRLDHAFLLTFHRVPRGSAGSTGSSCGVPAGGGASGGGGGRLEALDNLVISTIFSISTKLCLTSGKVIRRLQEQTEDKEHVEYLDTLVST